MWHSTGPGSGYASLTGYLAGMPAELRYKTGMQPCAAEHAQPLMAHTSKAGPQSDGISDPVDASRPQSTAIQSQHCAQAASCTGTCVGLILGLQGLLDPGEGRPLQVALRASPDQHLLHRAEDSGSINQLHISSIVLGVSKEVLDFVSP